VSHGARVKKAIASANAGGSQGHKDHVQGAGGRLGDVQGREYMEGRVPLHTLRADVDYARGHCQDHIRYQAGEGVGVHGEIFGGWRSPGKGAQERADRGNEGREVLRDA